MFRMGSLSLFGILLIACVAVINANPPDDADNRFNKALAVQTAMVRARALLNERNPQKAVDVLEEQLPKVNGNTEYLMLLRDAYRAHIKDLHLSGQAAPAKRYLDRLCILDPNAASDPALQAPKALPPTAFEQPEPKQTKLPFPNFKMPTLPNPFAKKEEPKAPVSPPSVVRGVPANVNAEDPFDKKFRRESSLDVARETKARELLTLGAAEFKNERYAQARMYFEQAYHAEASAIDACREQWAYCIIKGVSDTMEQPGVLPAKLPELQKQVEGAIQMAPTKMMVVGQQLLDQLDQRARRPQLTAVVASVRHAGQNKEGWQVAETKHFRIFHKQNQDHAERVAQIAETTRQAMFRKWFGTDGSEWAPICELIIHPDAAAYSQMTGVPGNSPGHSRIESDPSGRVVARRMDMRLDAAGMMDAVLPHETTHVVLAGMFGSSPVPRWCDEGIAVLAEPNEKIEQHRRNLLKHHRDGQLFGLKELMELKDYPQARRVGAFYAQSVVLTEFLTQQKSPRVLTDFIRDGLRYGYEPALQKHYNMTFTQLEAAWQQQILNGGMRFTAQK